MAMSYVAQIASGANQMQTIKAFEEAEKFPGPSLIIAYTPCITHGLFGGMKESIKRSKRGRFFWILVTISIQSRINRKRTKYQ